MEADQIVLNLTTYETYYPEKRPFFLEGTDIFATPGQLVYTRRIGRVPPVPTLRPNEGLLDVPLPSTIYGASKLTGRLAEGWTVGTLQALTAPDTVPVRAADGSHVSRVVQPLSAWNVLRLRRDLGDRAYVGLHGHQRDARRGRRQLPARRAGYTGYGRANGVSDVGAGGAEHHPGRSGVPLLRRCLRGGRRLAMALAGGRLGEQRPGRRLDAGPRSPASGAGRHGDPPGPGGHRRPPPTSARKAASTGWATSGADTRTASSTINDLGFNPRGNVIYDGFDLEYRTLVPWWKLLETHTRLEATSTTTNTATLPISRGVNLNTAGKLDNFWRYFVELDWRPTLYDDREFGDGAALEHAAIVVGNDTRIQSDPTKPIAVALHVRPQALAHGGYNFSSDADLLLRALPQLDFDLAPTFTANVGEPRYVDHRLGGRRVRARPSRREEPRRDAARDLHLRPARSRSRGTRSCSSRRATTTAFSATSRTRPGRAPSCGWPTSAPLRLPRAIRTSSRGC